MTQNFSHHALVDPGDLEALQQSGTFDPEWYAAQYRDVGMLGMNPAEHYLWIGRKLGRRPSRAASSSVSTSKSELCWGIVTTPHTLFVAEMIARELRRHGWMVDVMTEMPDTFGLDQYIVLCAQMFDWLPPGERRIIYQLEQSVSSRWFTPEYLATLENSSCVIDYALENITFLERKGIAFPHVYYLPIGAMRDDGGKIERKKFDVLFYGDYKSSPRRRAILNSLRGKFNITLADEVFGDDIKMMIRQSKVVLNLHYYENALLEMPRIQECLSLGVPVVSEAAVDSDDYPFLGDAVRFFDTGRSDQLESLLEKALRSHDDIAHVAQSVERSESLFRFMFDRFLIDRNLLPVHAIDKMAIPELTEGEAICVSLPETITRRRQFETERPRNCTIFNGMRRRPGWIGCGLSYKVLAQQALRQGLNRLTVMEDDVLLPDDIEARMEIVNEYLDGLDGEWDVFSAVIASLHPECKVRKVERFRGMEFVTVDKMTSTVFNMYNRRALQLIADWRPIESDVENNTIDRYLENKDLRIVTVAPYLVGHREELYSTLWGFQNTQYAEMIRDSERDLALLKDAWIDLSWRPVDTLIGVGTRNA